MSQELLSQARLGERSEGRGTQGGLGRGKQTARRGGQKDRPTMPREIGKQDTTGTLGGGIGSNTGALVKKEDRKRWLNIRKNEASDAESQ